MESLHDSLASVSQTFLRIHTKSPNLSVSLLLSFFKEKKHWHIVHVLRQLVTWHRLSLRSEPVFIRWLVLSRFRAGRRKVKAKDGETLFVNDFTKKRSWSRPVAAASLATAPQRGAKGRFGSGKNHGVATAKATRSRHGSSLGLVGCQ